MQPVVTKNVEKKGNTVKNTGTMYNYCMNTWLAGKVLSE
jgi:hypothetical protein